MAGLAAMMLLTVASAVATLSNAASDPSPVVLAVILMGTATSIVILSVLIVGLMARSRFAHAAAIVVVVYLLAGFGYQFVSKQVVAPLSIVGTVIGVATLAVLVLDRSRYWRLPSAASMTPPAAGASTRASALLYAILTIAALSMSLWVFFHATFGQIADVGPPDWAIAAAALAVLALAGGGALLGTHPPGGTVLSAGGLVVTAVAFAGVYRPEDGIAAQTFKLGVTVLAIVGIGLLAVRGSDTWRSTDRPGRG